ncbi:MAG: PAS domain S-box protein [Nitrospira sp.]|nr:PAS domain S-box protein [Nitrospira sp.]
MNALPLARQASPWAIPLLTVAIFLFDYATPVGVAGSMLYVIPLLLTYFTSVTRRGRDPLYFSLIASSLLWVNLFLKPAGLPITYGAFNRVLGMCVLWAVAVAVLNFKRMQQEIADTAAAKKQSTHDLQAEQVERAHAEALMMAAQEARAHADVASLGAAVGKREAEEKLVISQQRLKGVIESAMDAIITVDEDQRIVMFNRAAEEMFGVSPADSMGQPLEQFLPARFRDAHRHHVQGFGQSGVTSRKMGKLGTVMGIRTNGEEFPIEAAISHNSVDGRKFYTVILRDISERKKLEEQLRRTERVAELGTLASGMAHEIGTPMNVILGRAEYLMDRVKDEPTKKGLQTIIAQVERITRVMNQLLAFARRKPPERGPLQLQDIVENGLELFRERIEKSRVTVEPVLDKACPKVLADGDQMSQVVINLVMNALHAMPDGGTLRIGLAQEHGKVMLTVADTGHGIPHEDLPRIFEPFFTTKEFGKGTGLGLTVVKGIIDEHQGTITVDSEVGKGTTFTVLLPKSV